MNNSSSNNQYLIDGTVPVNRSSNGKGNKTYGEKVNLEFNGTGEETVQNSSASCRMRLFVNCYDIVSVGLTFLRFLTSLRTIITKSLVPMRVIMLKLEFVRSTDAIKNFARIKF
jgi:hypothetical protein